MEKNLLFNWNPFKKHRFRKIFLTMKLIALFTLVMIGQIFASQGYSQSTRINLNMANVTVKDVLNVIEDNTEFYFLYNSKIIDVERKVDINVENKAIEETLNKLFAKTNVDFNIIDRQIVLSPKDINVSGLQSTGTVTGKVIYSDGKPITGVTVFVKGTTTGTITQNDGTYQLTVNQNAIIVFSFIGMKSQEVIYSGQKTINITLEDETIGIDEVVAIGYGTVQKKDVIGAIVNVDVKDLGSKSLNSVAEALQGKISGVTISNNGGPNEGQSITIRGLSTLNASSPLWIVDGVINANGVSPNEIESITVLKDASAAIYGTRAAGGVILVTTKKGKKGLNIDLDVKYGLSTPWKKLDVLDAQGYIDVYSKALTANNLSIPAMFSDSYFQTTRTNWLDEVFRTATNKDYNLSIGGGNEKVTFNIFANWNDTEGILHNTYSEGGRIRIKSDQKVNSRITFGQNISFTTGQSQGTVTNEGYSGTLISAVYYPPSANVWIDKANGIYSGTVDATQKDISLAGQFGDLRNPYAGLDRLNGFRPNMSVMLNGYANLEIMDGLTFKSAITYKASQNYNKVFTYMVPEVGKPVLDNRLSNSARVDKSIVAEQTLNFEKTFKDVHKVSVLAGYSSEEYESQDFGISARTFANEDTWAQEFGNASNYDIKPYSGYGAYSLISMIGRASYSYADKYYVSGIIRRDGTSKAMKDNRWGVFPSLQAGWRISEEGFLANVNFISDMKIRGSWGKMGNIAPLGDFPFSVNMKADDSSMIGANPLKTKGYYMDGISNPNIQWETTTTKNIGLDALFLDSKLSLTLDVYDKSVTDMLAKPALIDFAGVGSAPWVNIGETSNKGYEFIVGWRDNIKDFNYNVSFNLSHNTNELIKYTNTEDFAVHTGTGDHMRAVLYPFRSEVGHPLFSYYLIENDGIFQTDAEAQAYTKDGNMIQPNAKAGDLKFVDRDNDGNIDKDDKYFAGDYYPDFTYGINFGGNYKNWDFDLFFQGVQGVDIFAGYKLSVMKPTQGYNLLADAQNAWSTSNTGSDIPRLQMQDPNNNYSTESDWYLEDGSYVRLKNVTLGYTMPINKLSTIGVSKLRLFLTGQNLLTFTKYDGFDPEVGGKGLDQMKYPQSRTIMIGANISF